MSGDDAYGAPGPGATRDLQTEVRNELMALGATASEVDRAFADGCPHLLALNLALLPRHGRFSQRDIADRVGMDIGLLRRVDRALGLPVVDPDEPAFTTVDVEVAADLQELVDAESIDEATLLQVMRILGSSMAKVADSHVAMAVRHLTRRIPDVAVPDDDIAEGDAEGDAAGDAEVDAAGDAGVTNAEYDAWPLHLALWIPRLVGERLPQFTRLIEYAYQTHLVSTTQRELLLVGGERGDDVTIVESLAIGFADLAGFTAMSGSLASRDLEKALERFEQVAWDAVAEAGGRVVKLIGDEVMFVAASARGAVEIGLGLAERMREDAVLPDVRVGVAFGEALGRGGDYYGPTVNLASRLCGLAFPGSVLSGEAVVGAVEAERDARVAFTPLRKRRLKGIGHVKVFVARRS